MNLLLKSYIQYQNEFQTLRTKKILQRIDNEICRKQNKYNQN